MDTIAITALLSQLDLINAKLDRVDSQLNKIIENTTKKKSKKAGTKPDDYDMSFNSMYADYPYTYGANKRQAYAAYKKRLSETRGKEAQAKLLNKMHMGVVNYAKHCKATGRMVMMPSTFFGPSAHYECDWTIPAQAIKKDKLPFNDDALPAWAQSKGYRQAKPGETYFAYRKALELLHNGED